MWSNISAKEKVGLSAGGEAYRWRNTVADKSSEMLKILTKSMY